MRFSPQIGHIGLKSSDSNVYMKYFDSDQMSVLIIWV